LPSISMPLAAIVRHALALVTRSEPRREFSVTTPQSLISRKDEDALEEGFPLESPDEQPPENKLATIGANPNATRIRPLHPILKRREVGLVICFSFRESIGRWCELGQAKYRSLPVKARPKLRTDIFCVATSQNCGPRCGKVLLASDIFVACLLHLAFRLSR